MPFLSPAFLRSLRETNRASLDSLATILVRETTTNPGGANTGKGTWRETATAIPCRLSTVDGAPIVIQAGQLTTPDRVAVVFDLEGPDVAEGNRITVTGTDIAGQAWTRTVIVLTAQFPRTASAMRAFVCQDVGP